MAKVLFINPVIREEDKPKHVPYGMALLAQIAMDRGHQVQVYDANAWRKGQDVLEQVCAADDWDMIASGCLTTGYGSLKNIIKTAKRVNPKAMLVVGGGVLTSMPHEIMEWNPEIDLGVVGEAFITFPEILDKIDKKDFDFSNTLGVCYRDKNGKSKLTAVRPNIADLDTLPYPAFDLFPLDIYFENSAELYSAEMFTSKRRIDVNGSLGCGLVCRYCWHLGIIGDMVVEPNEKGENDVRFSYGRNIRYHSPDYIVKFVKHLVDKYQIDFVGFIDENMMTMDAASGRTWLLELSQKWIDAGLQPTCRRDGVPHDDTCKGVHWGGTSHASLALKPTLEAMAKAGCSHLVYGIESFDPKILKNLGKATTVEHNYRAPRECMEAGIAPLPNIIIGFPEETFESIRNTLKGMMDLKIHSKPHFATPYPGSEWYYSYKQDIIRQYDGDLEKYILSLGDASSITAVICHKFSAMELLGLQQIMKDWNWRLLDQAEKHWGKADEGTVPVATPRESFNFVRKRLKAPIEGEAPKPATAT